MTSAGIPLPIEVDCRAVKARRDAGDDFVLLDCREQDEYDLVRIAGATLVPMSQLTDRVGELAPFRDRSIVVHCHHGGRSLRVAGWLRDQGFSQVQSMAGGIHQWALDIDRSMGTY